MTTNARVLAFAILTLAACGGAVETAPSPPTLAQDAPEAVPTAPTSLGPAVAVPEASSADAAPVCACALEGWVCGGVVAPDAESCLYCGLWCDSADHDR